MSTLTIANSCTSQRVKERGALPNETRKKDALKIPDVISHLFPTPVAAVVISRFSMAKSFAFDPYWCSSIDILTLRLLMSYIYIYIYGAPILDVSRSHTTTQHSR